jgi:hypothetical protein
MSAFLAIDGATLAAYWVLGWVCAAGLFIFFYKGDSK